MKYILTICIAFIFNQVLNSQTVILEREEDGVLDSTYNSIFDEDEPGRNTFIAYTTFGIGFPVSPSVPGAEIHAIRSLQINYGAVALFPLSKYFAPGFDLTYNYYAYSLKQEEGKTLPVAYNENESEKINLNCIQGGPVLRITYMPKDSKQGNYIDLSTDIVWVAGRNHFTRNENQDGSITEILTRKLDYTNTFQYIAKVRLGFGPVAIFGSYRLTDVFKETYLFPELPNVNAGIEILIGG